VSQTSRRSARRISEDDMIVEKERIALGEMPAEEFYAMGCDSSSIFIVPADEETRPQDKSAEDSPGANLDIGPAPSALDFAPEITLEVINESADVDALMTRDEPALKAAVLEPIDGTGEVFELWESGSSKDESEVTAALESR